MGRRRKKGNIINGWVNLDKPYDLTSTDAVGIVRKLLNAQKAGHGGTLDPLATGILPIALGEATKMVPYCQDSLKTYEFEVTWGEQRTTDDSEGEVINSSDNRPSREEIENVLPAFTGDIMQVPPQFSAIKINGQRAYDLARDGQDVKIEPRPTYIETIKMIEASENTATLRCVCGKGTYVRSLARDIAEKLGTYGYVSKLRRTAVGGLKEKNAISLAKLREIVDSADPEAMDLSGFLLPVQTVLDDIPALAINEAEVTRLKNGQSLSFIAKPDFKRIEDAGLAGQEDATALAIYNGKTIAIVKIDGADVSPARVFNL